MKKNVLIFGHGYAHGFLEATRQYIKLFDDQKYNITVVYLNGEANKSIAAQHKVQNVIFLNASNQDKRGLKLDPIKKMLKLHKEYNFQIVISHRYKPSYIMLCVSKLHKIPVNIAVMHEMGTIKNISRKLFIALFANKNTYFAGVSNAVRNNIRQSIIKFPKEKVITLYNSIDLEETKSNFLNKHDARDKLGIPQDTFLFGILGRLAPAKDHHTLINAFKIAKTKCSNIKLLIIGDGELKDSIKLQINKLDLNQDIIMTGFLDNALSVLKSLDAFVLSSIQEAFGRVLIEAMTAKLPIIATKANGIPEVLGNTGQLVEKQNPNELANAMCTYYNSSKKALSHEGEVSYQRAYDIFSIRKFKTDFWSLPILANIN